jgi:GNAT superfamily N-acetyltransferase
MIAKQLANLRERLRHGTLFEAFQYRLSRAGIVVAPYYWVQEGIGHERLDGAYGALEGFTFGVFGPAELRIIAAGKTWNYAEEELLAWLGRGRICIGMKHGEEIAAFMWIDLSECDCRYFRLALEENEAYLFDMFTMKPFRGRGLAPFLRYQSYRLLKELGRDTLYSYSDYFNKPSIAFKKKLHAVNVRLSMYLEFRNDWRRNILLRTYPASRPRLIRT